MRADEVDTLRFQSRRERQVVRESGTPFWRIVWAVFTALCLFGLLQLALGAIVYRAVLNEIDRMAQEWKRQADALMPKPGEPVFGPPTVATRPDSGRRQLPAMPGPIEARKRGDGTACIGGRISERLPDGWNQSNERCQATTQ